MDGLTSFNAVQNNTSLKPTSINTKGEIGFNAVQNNTSLKHSFQSSSQL